MKDLAHLKVLLVEDNEADIILTEEILTQADFSGKLMVVRDGAEAIEFIAKQNQYTGADTPDLILLDINLPKINGKEVLVFLKENEQYKSITVIVFSSSNNQKDILFCYESNANLYLEKPNTIPQYEYVIECIKKIMLSL